MPQNNFKVGMPFSTFNCLYADHIKMLEEVKRIRNYLIVGLQTDLLQIAVKKKCQLKQLMSV